jgi:hypothetical protein
MPKKKKVAKITFRMSKEALKYSLKNSFHKKTTFASLVSVFAWIGKASIAPQKKILYRFLTVICHVFS